MTRPLALIEGDLTIPLPRPFDGLPPPFGSRRNLIREAVQRTVRESIRPKPASMFPPGVRHVLFYKTPPRRVDNSFYDAALAEAKRYLEMGTARPRSSRSDRVLSVAIFAGCSIALTWLLITCSMKEADKAKALDATSSVKSAAKQRVDQPKIAPRLAVAEPQTPEGSANAASQASQLVPVSPTPIIQMVPRQVVQPAAREEHSTTPSAKRENRVKVARLSGTHVNERVILNRTSHFATRPVASAQPEWTAKALPSQNIASTDSAAPWLNWTAPQQRPVVRAATPVDSHWNDHMTQRRITDDPTAFNIEHSGQ